jgi:hypothetical protein
LGPSWSPASSSSKSSKDSPPKGAKLKKKELLLTSFLGAILVEKYASSDWQRFLFGFLVGVVSNVLSWQGVIPKKTMIWSGISAGIGATSFNGMMKALGSSPKTASAFGVFLGSIGPPLIF